MLTLTFPEARNVGRLFATSGRQDVPPYWSSVDVADVDIVADAHGQVHVETDRAAHLVLAVNPLGGADLSFLGELPADVLYGVSLNARDTNPEQLRWLSKITGLQQIRVSQVPSTWTDWRWLGTLPQLRTVRMSGDGVTEGIFPFLARATHLQHLDLSGSAIDGTGLAAVRSLPLLTELELNSVPTLCEEGWAAIGRLQHLRSLSLGGSWDFTELQDLDYDELLRYLGSLQQLERLAIWDLPLGGHGYRHLRSLTKLRYLNISAPHNRQPQPGDLAHLRNIPALEVVEMEATTLDAEALTQLATIPRLTRLNCRQYLLSIEKPLRGHDGVEQLLQAVNLRELVLSGNSPDDEAVRLLGQLRHLKVLDLSGVTDYGAGQLTGLHNLQTLTLSLTEVGGAGVAALGELHQLREFYLSAPALDDLVLRSILEGMPQLRRLGLGLRGERGIEGLPYLQVQSLESLSLGANTLRPEWFVFLPSAHRLRTLTLMLVPLTAQLVRTIAEAPTLAHLNLTETGVDDEALEPIGTMTTLRSVHLAGNPIGTAGLRALLPLQGLQYLDLSKTEVDDEAVSLLRQFPKLTTANCWGNKMTPEAKQQLRIQLPNCTVL